MRHLWTFFTPVLRECCRRGGWKNVRARGSGWGPGHFQKSGKYKGTMHDLLEKRERGRYQAMADVNRKMGKLAGRGYLGKVGGGQCSRTGIWHWKSQQVANIYTFIDIVTRGVRNDLNNDK